MLEQELRETLHAATDTIDVSDDSLATIESRLDAAGTAARNRWPVIVTVAAAAVILFGTVGVLARHGRERVNITAQPSSRTLPQLPRSQWHKYDDPGPKYLLRPDGAGPKTPDVVIGVRNGKVDFYSTVAGKFYATSPVDPELALPMTTGVYALGFAPHNSAFVVLASGRRVPTWRVPGAVRNVFAFAPGSDPEARPLIALDAAGNVVARTEPPLKGDASGPVDVPGVTHLAMDDVSVYATTDAGDIVRINRTDLARDETHMSDGTGLVAAAGGTAWFTDASGRWLSLLGRRQAGAAIPTIDHVVHLAEPAVAMTGTSKSLWVLAGTRLIRVDTAMAQIDRSLEIGAGATNIAVEVDEHRAFIGYSSTPQGCVITAVDTETGRKLAQSRGFGGVGQINSMRIAGDQIIVAYPTGTDGVAGAYELTTLLNSTSYAGGSSNTVAASGTAEKMWTTDPKAKRLACFTTAFRLRHVYRDPVGYDVIVDDIGGFVVSERGIQRLPAC